MKAFAESTGEDLLLGLVLDFALNFHTSQNRSKLFLIEKFEFD